MLRVRNVVACVALVFMMVSSATPPPISTGLPSTTIIRSALTTASTIHKCLLFDYGRVFMCQFSLPVKASRGEGVGYGRGFQIAKRSVDVLSFFEASRRRRQNIIVARDPYIESRQQEDTHQQRRDQSADDYNRERSLGV